MSDVTLKEACEIALAREFYKVATLRSITPKTWADNARALACRLSIQASPTGDEMVYRTGIYAVDIAVRVEGKPRKFNAAEYTAQVDAVFGELSRLEQSELQARFAGSGIYVHGVIPRQLPAAIEGDNRVDMAGCQLVARLDC